MAKFDPHEVWRLVGDEKVNSVMITGDAMGKPLIESLDDEGTEHDLSSLLAVVSSAALFSAPVKDQFFDAPAQPRDHRRHRLVGGRQQRHDGHHGRQHGHEERPDRAPPGRDGRVRREPRPGRARLGRHRQDRPLGRHPARATTTTRRRRPRSSSRCAAPATSCRATSPRSRRTAPSPCSVAARSSSTPVARRSSPRRSSPPCARIPTSWTPSSAGRPTSAGARRWPPSSSPVVGHEAPSLGVAAGALPRARSPATSCPAGCTSSTRSSARPAGSPTTPGPPPS